jgi:DNA modification methylase
MYKFVSEKENYEDYSSGRVLYGTPEATNFSVRIASEIFLRCKDYLSKNAKQDDYRIYDPFCGAGYSLTVLGLLYGKLIKTIFASDYDNHILEFAQKNLGLLKKEGIQKRISELEKFILDFGKDSHREALQSAKKIEKVVQFLDIETNIFQFNMLCGEELPDSLSNIDIVITDIPYGKIVNWVGLKEGENPVQVMLDKIKGRLSKFSVVAIVYNKQQEIKHEGFVRLKKFSIGKRKILLLCPALSAPNL